MSYSRLTIPHQREQLIRTLKNLSEIVDGFDTPFNKKLKKTLQTLKKLDTDNLSFRTLAGFIDLDIADTCAEILSHPKNLKKQDKIREKLQVIYKRLLYLKAMVKFPTLKEYRAFEEVIDRALTELGFTSNENNKRFTLRQ